MPERTQDKAASNGKATVTKAAEVKLPARAGKPRAKKSSGRVTKPKARLRLVKVLVEPHFVLDDGADGLQEVVGDAIAVPGSQWREWVKDAFSPAILAQLQKVNFGGNQK